MKLLAALFLLAVTVQSQNISLKVTPGENWENSFKAGLFTINTTPQFAIWLADTSGNYLATLQVTEKGAIGKYSGPRNTTRPSSLPVWSWARGIKNEIGSYMPSKKSSLVDAETCASPKSEATITCSIPDSLVGKTTVIMVEVNNSMDFNSFYQKEMEEDAPGFNNGVNGQPSIVYKAVLSSQTTFPLTLQIAGHGEPAGRSGEIFINTENITTGLKLVSSLVVSEVAE